MSNKAALLGESLENLFLVNLPTEIPENPPSDMSKNATFLTSQQASEVREPYLSTDSSLSLSEDTHNTSTLLAFGLDAPKQFYDQWFGSEYQPVAEQGLNASIPLDYPAINDSGIYFPPLSPQQSSTASSLNGDIVMYTHLPVFGIICTVFIHGYYLNTPFPKLFYLHNTQVLGEPTPHAKECSATYLTSL